MVSNGTAYDADAQRYQIKIKQNQIVIAQRKAVYNSVEKRLGLTFNQLAVGSIPTPLTNVFNGLDCGLTC